MVARASRFSGETIISVGLLKNGRCRVDITYSGELRYGKTYMTARLWYQAKPDFLLYAGTWKDGSTFSLLHAHQSITSTTLIFDKCHVRCYRPRVSCIEGIIDFGRGSIQNCQLRRLLHGETSSAINFRSER